MEETFFGNDEFFEIEMLQDGSVEFEAEAECTCTGDPVPTCSCCT
jgi:hypothetical protein